MASTSARAAGTNPAKSKTPSSMLLLNHLRDNVSQLTVRDTRATVDMVQDIVDNLFNAISNEVQVLSAVYTKLQDVANTAIDLLDTRIYIPVISDFLAAIGVPSISFLDLFSWISAVSFDVVYQIMYGSATFPDNGGLNELVSASSWEDISRLFGKAADVNAASQPKAAEALTLPHELAKAFHIAGHAAAGFSIVMGNFLQAFEAEVPTGDNPFSLPGAIPGIVTAVLGDAADILVPSDPIDNAAVSASGTATTIASLVSKIIFSGPVQGRLAVSSSEFSALAVQNGRATPVIISSILIVPSLFVTGWHFYQLSQKPAGIERSAAVVSEVSELTSYGATISYAVAVNLQEPVSRQEAIIAMVACNVATGGLQTAEAFLVKY